MRYLLLLLSICFSSVSYGQKCSCKKASELKEFISCKKVLFSSGGKLYRQFDCDSSWLTFESKNGRKTILFSLEAPLVELTERLGYQYTREYKKTFLIMNRVISGCCTPPEFLLFNKHNGKLVKNLGRLIYYSDRADDNLVLFFSDTELNFIALLFVDSGKEYKISIPTNRFATTLEKTGGNYAELLFGEGEIENSVFTIGYRYQKKEDSETWYNDTIRLDLKKYLR